MSEEKRIDRIERITEQNAKGLEELRLARVEDQSKMESTRSFMEATVSRIQSENAQTLSRIQSENAQTLSKIHSENAKIQSENAKNLAENAQTLSRIESENAKNLAENAQTLSRIETENAKARETLHRENSRTAWKMITGSAVGGAIAGLIAIYLGSGQ